MSEVAEVGGERLEVLLSAERIAARLPSLAAEVLARDLASDAIAVVALKGGLVFGADLLRHLPHTFAVDYVQARSYGSGVVSSGHVELLRDALLPIEGRDVVLIDDIVDTGLTSAFLLAHLRSRGARRVELVALLDKPERRKADVGAAITGFAIPDVFAVGYGLDLAERYRGLPFVGVPLGASDCA